MTRDIPFKVLLIGGFLVSGLVPLMAASIAGLSAARGELNDQAFRQLESVRDNRKAQVERYFEDAVRQVRMLASDPRTAAALRNLGAVARDAGGVRALGLAGHRDGHFDAPESYRQVHDRYAGPLQAFARANGFYDVFLLDARNGATLFTVQKEEDFGITVSALDSPLREVWEAAVSGRVGVSDTRLYAPSDRAPAQFVAAPVEEDGRVVGVAAVQVALQPIDRIMAERAGMGETGEAYLVGPDLRMRSDSSTDPAHRSVAASFAGSISENGVDTEATRAVFAGETGSRVIRDVHGSPVLASFAPVRIQGVTWAVVAQVARSEIEGKIASSLDRQIEVILGLSVILLIVLGLGMSWVVGRGIGNVVGELRRLIDQVLQGRLDARGDRDRVAADFREVMDRTNDLVAAFCQQTRQRQKLEEVIEVNQRMESIGTLAGGIAHDFNNILTYMQTYGELARQDMPADAPARAHVTAMMEGIERSSELVAQIRVFGRQMTLEKVPVRLAMIVKEAIKLLKATLPASIRLVRRIECADLRVMADPTQLHRVVMNLCTNAFQAMQDTGGVLTVTVSPVHLEEGEVADVPAGDYARLSVQDTGCGMDSATLARVFEPFFSTRPVGEGTGMGLAVVHGIVQSCGGAITFESAPGKGTTARVYLPVAGNEAEEPGEESRPEPVRGSGTILVVDDEAEIRASAALMLESLGYSVLTASTGVEAEAIVRRDPAAISLVLTDLSMPGMDGFALTGALKALRPDLAVVVMTGYNEGATPDAARKHGASALLTKPFRAETLSRTLAEAAADR